MTIEIRDGRIYFFNANKPEIQVQDFQCISAYVCPVCKKVLIAYFVGHIIEIIDYNESEKQGREYEIGHSNGGTWISLLDYMHKKTCIWHYSTARGVINGVNAFLRINEKNKIDK